MIIIGYQGIGKSTFSKNHQDFIDLESSCFFDNGFREPNWYKYYCNVAEHLSKQGYNVFVSSHSEVRWQLKKCSEDVIAIVPNLNLKDQWLERLKNRYEESGLEKDKKAYLNTEERFEENIKEIMKDCITVVVDNIDDHNFEEMIKKGKIKLEIDSLINDEQIDKNQLEEVRKFISTLK